MAMREKNWRGCRTKECLKSMRLMEESLWLHDLRRLYAECAWFVFRDALMDSVWRSKNVME